MSRFSVAFLLSIAVAVAGAPPALAQATPGPSRQITGSVTYQSVAEGVHEAQIFGTDTLVTNIAPPFGACGVASCNAVASITAFSIASNVVTFQAVNSFVSGQKVSIAGLTSTPGSSLNGFTLTVLGSGLSASQFQAGIPSGLGDVNPTGEDALRH